MNINHTDDPYDSLIKTQTFSDVDLTDKSGSIKNKEFIPQINMVNHIKKVNDAILIQPVSPLRIPQKLV